MLEFSLRRELPAGTVLKEGTRVYRITRTISSGGFSIVYSAVANEKEYDTVAIKEIFPDNSGFYRGDDLIIRCPDAKTAEVFRQLTEKEYAYGRQIARTSGSGRVIVLGSPLKVDYINRTACSDNGLNNYYVMDKIDERGVFLEDFLTEIDKYNEGNRPFSRVYVAARIIYQVLYALKDVHDSGFVHGDIWSNNLFVNKPDLKTDDFGDISIIDFGSARKVNEEADENEMICGTRRNAAPEVLHVNGRISYYSDIYSVGLLMWDILFRGTADSNRRDSFDNRKRDVFITPTAAYKVGCKDRSEYLQLKKILAKAVNKLPEMRYQNAAEMLTDVKELLNKVEPQKEIFRNNLVSINNEEFIGRDDDVNMIAARIINEPLTTVYGEGGIGKTETGCAVGNYLAERGWNVCRISYVSAKADDSGLNPFERAIVSLNYRDNVNNSHQTVREEYETKIRQLADNYDLVIVDNVDDYELTVQQLVDTDALNILLEKVKVLLISRQSFNGASIKLNPLKLDYCYKIITRHCHGGKVNKELVYKIIDMVDRNTLIISLIDVLLAERRMSFEQFIKEFEQHELTEDYHSIGLHKNQKYLEYTLMEHIRKLFLIDELKKPDLDILARTVIFSPDGFSYEAFRNILISEANSNQRSAKQKILRLEKLINKGFIREFVIENEVFINTHALIKEIFIEEYSYKKLEKYLKQLGKTAVSRYSYNNLYRTEKALNMAMTLYGNKMPEDVKADYLLVKARICGRISDYEKMENLEKQVLSILEAADEPDLFRMAEGYKNIAITYGRLRRFEECNQTIERGIRLYREYCEKQNKTDDNEMKIKFREYISSRTWSLGLLKQYEEMEKSAIETIEYIESLEYSDNNERLIGMAMAESNLARALSRKIKPEYEKALIASDNSIRCYYELYDSTCNQITYLRILREMQNKAEILLRQNSVDSLAEADELMKDVRIKLEDIKSELPENSYNYEFARILSLQNSIDIEEGNDISRIAENTVCIFRLENNRHLCLNKSYSLKGNGRYIYRNDGDTLYIFMYSAEEERYISRNHGICFENSKQQDNNLPDLLQGCTRTVILYSENGINACVNNELLNRIVEKAEERHSVVLPVFYKAIQIPPAVFSLKKRREIFEFMLNEWIMSPKLKELLELYGFEGNGDLGEINDFVNIHYDFRKNRERFDIMDSEFELDNREKISELVTVLNIPGLDDQLQIDHEKLKNSSVDYFIIFGATAAVNRRRMRIAGDFCKEHPESKVIVLTGERPLTDSEKELYDNSVMTESDSIHQELTDVFDGENTTVVIDSCKSPDETRRVQTADQIEHLLSHYDLNGKSIAVISSSRYRIYTLILLFKQMLKSECNADVYFTGQTGSITEREKMSAYLQEIKAMVNQIHGFVKKG